MALERSAISSNWLRLTTIDAHTAGEPLRIITGGWPPPEGRTILEKRRFLREHHDHLRRLLMYEPRGHADMYGCLLTAPTTPDGHVGVLFMHNEGYSTMCGHGIIGLVKVGLEEGLFHPDPVSDEIRIDTPAGRVTAWADWQDGQVSTVSFENVASFVLEPKLLVEVPGWGQVNTTIAFGGAFYAYVSAPAVGLELTPRRTPEIVRCGRAVKAAVSEQYTIRHPTGDEELNFLYGAIFTGQSMGDAHSRNVCIFADGEVDRSPTGTGVSGRAAIHYSGGEILLGEPIRIESILGTGFDVKVVRETKVGDRDAVIPLVTGSAHITGRHEFVLDPSDELPSGFLLR